MYKHDNFHETDMDLHYFAVIPLNKNKPFHEQLGIDACKWAAYNHPHTSTPVLILLFHLFFLVHIPALILPDWC